MSPAAVREIVIVANNGIEGRFVVPIGPGLPQSKPPKDVMRCRYEDRPNG